MKIQKLVAKKVEMPKAEVAEKMLAKKELLTKAGQQEYDKRTGKKDAFSVKLKLPVWTKAVEANPIQLKKLEAFKPGALLGAVGVVAATTTNITGAVAGEMRIKKGSDEE